MTSAIGDRCLTGRGFKTYLRELRLSEKSKKMKWNKKKRRPSQKTMRHIKANKATGAIIRKNKELANVEQIAKERGVPVSRVYAEMWGGNGKNKVRKA